MKALNIEFQSWHYTCGDGCCTDYGTDVYLNGELLETLQEDGTKTDVNGDDPIGTVMAVLQRLGYQVEIERTCKD